MGGSEVLIILAIVAIPILLVVFIFKLGKKSGEDSARKKRRN